MSTDSSEPMAAVAVEHKRHNLAYSLFGLAAAGTLGVGAWLVVEHQLGSAAREEAWRKVAAEDQLEAMAAGIAAASGHVDEPAKVARQVLDMMHSDDLDGVAQPVFEAAWRQGPLDAELLHDYAESAFFATARISRDRSAVRDVAVVFGVAYFDGFSTRHGLGVFPRSSRLRVVGHIAELTVDGAEAFAEDAGDAGHEGSFFLIHGLKDAGAAAHDLRFKWSADIVDTESGQVLAQVQNRAARLVAEPGLRTVYVELQGMK